MKEKKKKKIEEERRGGWSPYGKSVAKKKRFFLRQKNFIMGIFILLKKGQ